MIELAGLDKKWYSSHGRAMPWSEFIELEVDERENYEMEEIQEWEEKYNLQPDTPVIWVTNMAMCKRQYIDPVWYQDDYKESMEDEKEDPVEITDIREIIHESDDGDEGYLAILK